MGDKNLNDKMISGLTLFLKAFVITKTGRGDTSGFSPFLNSKCFQS